LTPADPHGENAWVASTPEQLIRPLSEAEDSFTERNPEGAHSRDIRRTLVAFANSVPEGRDAALYVGVGGNGAVLGVSNPESLQQTIRNICDQQCYPPIRFVAEALTVNDKVVLAVVVPFSAGRPHFAGRAYVRVGSSSIDASEQMFNELLTQRLAKCRAIIECKDQLVTVVARAKELGSTTRLGDNGYRAVHECRVIACEPHYVRLFDIGTDRYISEPIENVTLSRDERRGRRLMLIVKEP
jgi:hypothetical protein